MYEDLRKLINFVKFLCCNSLLVFFIEIINRYYIDVDGEYVVLDILDIVGKVNFLVNYIELYERIFCF